jgi:PTS system mannose-specific IIA component
MMLGLLVVTHGRVAEELVASARTIVGDVEGLEAVSIDWNDDVDEATRRIGEARRRVDSGQGVLLLTDMFGGTPTNLALSLLEPGKLEIVTGVNLPMLIKFTNLREERSLLETADAIAEEARQAVRVASRLLQRHGERTEGEAP